MVQEFMSRTKMIDKNGEKTGVQELVEYLCQPEIVYRMITASELNLPALTLIANELEKELPKVLHMFHANDKDGAEEWISDIRQAFPEMDFKLYPLPISFAVHAGEGTIAISY